MSASEVKATCDTCKWWGVATWYRHSRGSRKACEHIGDNPALKDSGVSPIHDNDFGSELFTGPKFGCIHHEPRQPAPKPRGDVSG